MSEREAADRLFEFRVADIAMGSGHFLVAALDHIERRFQNYLVKRDLRGVSDELEHLRQAAREQLGDEFDSDALEDVRLLRRQIARRCIFGVDRNPLAVELARLSIWIHSFVPGLPLSFLDGNLIVGNSLVGIATFDEASDLIAADEGDLFGSGALERLKRAREPLEKLAKLSEATAKEVRQARDLYERARASIEDEERFLTVLTASRLDSEIQGQVALVSVGSISGEVEVPDALYKKAMRELKGLEVTHFPIAFPQVFMGERGGFDVILGNPPWEKTQVEEHEFWARHFPGLRGLTQAQRESEVPRLKGSRPDLAAALQTEEEEAAGLRKVLMTGPYPGMGRGHPDLYKAFCWRFLYLAAPKGGRIGVVLPRSALAARGSAEFRRELFKQAKSIELTMLLNNRQWVFPEVHPQYTIGLAVVERNNRVNASVPIELRGPYSSEARLRDGIVREGVRTSGAEITSWNDTASFPLLPSETSIGVFLRLRRSPRLDANDAGDWRTRPLQGDLNSTTGKGVMTFDEKVPKGYWPVYKGESFNIWEPDTGVYYAWADPREVQAVLQEKRLNGANGPNSPFSEFPREWVEDTRTLPCRHPRIAFRRIARATDTRTVIAALVPPSVVLVDTAPYFLWPRGDAQDEAYLLGVLCSRVFDWYARRFVETHLDFHVLNPFPLPRPERNAPLRRLVVATAGRLAARDGRFEHWAKSIGVQSGAVGVDEATDLIAILDAAVAHLYGLEELELRHIFDTFHEGWEYGPQFEVTLVHFRKLMKLA